MCYLLLILNSWVLLNDAAKLMAVRKSPEIICFKSKTGMHDNKSTATKSHFPWKTRHLMKVQNEKIKKV